MKFLTAPIIFALVAYSGTLLASSADYSQLPPAITQNNAPPVAMLALPKDHQLFFKAYSDYEDLDGDKLQETTFNASIEYIGYFDNKLCYEYNENGYFEPKDVAAKVAISGKPPAYYCNTAARTSYWSGNFLNWATMTRIDILRQTFYGGKRVTMASPPAKGTVLERSHIPGDSHSFAKYYDNDDIEQLTPYKRFINLNCPSGKDTKKCEAVQRGITLCNTTYATVPKIDNKNDGELSQNTTNAPYIRVARGNFSLWAAGERIQCKYWESDEINGTAVKMDSGLADGPANSAKLTSGTTSDAFNQLMSDLFSTDTSFYFFHDSPAVNTSKEDFKYVAKYEPPYSDKIDMGTGDTITNATNSQKIKDFEARVVACHPDFHNSTTSSSTCTKYGEELKPTGILQSTDPRISRVQWGLISGSYTSNKVGGALRRHVGPISNEIDTNGDFSYLKSGATQNGGIIAFLDNLRIANWGYYKSGIKNIEKSSYAGWSNCGAADDDAPWGKIAKFDNSQCVSWGNPMSEILMEAYHYLSGATTPSLTTTVTDETIFSNPVSKLAMKSLDWSANPLSPTKFGASGLKKCSPLTVLAINGSVTSYDRDNIAGFGSVTGAQITAATDLIGTSDLGAANYFIPSGTNDAKECKPQTISSLSAISGTCPEAPSLEGGYLMAGMAYKARTSNINSNLDSKVKTSAITLAMGEPKIQITANNSEVLILPTCKNLSTLNYKSVDTVQGNCSIVDFKIIEQNPSRTAGTFLVVWEDSQQGSDFDQDATQVIKYTVSGTNIKVQTRYLSKSTSDNLQLGFTISGVESDEGYHGLVNITAPDPGGKAWKELNFTAGMATTKVLESPLFYAAKWGGFNEKVGNDDKPLDASEWDQDGDKVPDNYIEVVDPKTLTEDIKKTMQITSPAAFSYAAVGSVNTLDNGTGISISTLFRNELERDLSGNSKPVSWLGSLTAYSRDANGYLYDDTGTSKGVLDSSDKILAFETITKDGSPVTYATRYQSADAFKAKTSLSSTPIGTLNASTPLWSAEKKLALLKNYSAQAAYSGSRKESRYIFTAVDSGAPDSDGIVADGSTGDTTEIPFTAASKDLFSRWLAAPAGTESALVNYIRGKESSAYRSRRLDFIPADATYSGTNDADDDSSNDKDANDKKEPWLLGDIVNSSPIVVGPPKAGFDRDYGDETYATFREARKHRANVVYVGANDGMLHAFAAETAGNFSAGDEMWAYVPFNLLPHLKWLGESDYQHNYYVDGRVKYYDVNIFPDDGVDGDHPGGWGTILVATMRTGGHPYDVNLGGHSQNLRSAVIVLDITNPEKAPKVIAEIPLPDGSYTNSNPDIVKFRGRDEKTGNFTAEKNKWYLAIGTGVTDTESFTSTEVPKLFLYDFATKKIDAGTTIGSEKGWVGGINSVDWNGDYQDDYIYFGTVEGTPAAPSGQLYRAKVNLAGTVGSPTKVLELGTGTKRAFAATPFTVVDKENKYWVFAGTGRYFTDDDNMTSNLNSYYAVKEPFVDGNITSTTSTSSLVDLKGISVQQDEAKATGTDVYKNRNDIVRAIHDKSGWYFDFENVNSRNYTSTILVNNLLVFNTYEPGDSCNPFGSGSQYQLDFFSGLPRAIRNGKDTSPLPKSRVIGIGAPSDPSPGNRTTTGTSLGGIDIVEIDPGAAPSSRQSWRELPYSQ